MDSLYIIALAMIIPFLLLVIGLSGSKRGRMNRLRGYQDVTTGMSEQDMLSIMGGGYSRSVLDGNIVKYEWRINGNSNVSGYTYIEHIEAQRVIIYVRDGVVSEIDSNIPVYRNRFAGSYAIKLIPLMIVFVVGIYFCGKYIPMYTKPKGVQPQNHTSNIVKDRAGYTKELRSITLFDSNGTGQSFELTHYDYRYIQAPYYNFLASMGVKETDSSKENGGLDSFDAGWINVDFSEEKGNEIFNLFEKMEKTDYSPYHADENGMMITECYPNSVIYSYDLIDENGDLVITTDPQYIKENCGSRYCVISEEDYNVLLDKMQELQSLASEKRE